MTYARDSYSQVKAEEKPSQDRPSVNVLNPDNLPNSPATVPPTKDGKSARIELGVATGMQVGIGTAIVVGIFAAIAAGISAGISAGIAAAMGVAVIVGMVVGIPVGMTVGVVAGIAAGCGIQTSGASLEVHAPRNAAYKFKGPPPVAEIAYQTREQTPDRAEPGPTAQPRGVSTDECSDIHSHTLANIQKEGVHKGTNQKGGLPDELAEAAFVLCWPLGRPTPSLSR